MLDDHRRIAGETFTTYAAHDRKLFDDASYDDLLKNGRTVLAQDLRADTKYVATAAFDRNPGNGDGWKIVIEERKLDADKPCNRSAPVATSTPATGAIDRHRPSWPDAGAARALT
ncbi:hypothetical protein [Burkholderia pseudomultivorans]|uniref:Uncharacterized protein n=1 Tax=Burkholderia pseudomultivorans TaxID=1207504 RepID=A0A132EAP2_9BURK|nr:hypothetical protein WT56_01410 [Burkholderia pseudomultivorans]